MTLQYQASHPDAVEQIARLARSFMPANARIIPSELGGTLLVTDSAPNLKKLYGIIQQEDQRPTPEMKRRWAEWDRERMNERINCRQKDGPPMPTPPKAGTKSR